MVLLKHQLLSIIWTTFWQELGSNPTTQRLWKLFWMRIPLFIILLNCCLFAAFCSPRFLHPHSSHTPAQSRIVLFVRQICVNPFCTILQSVAMVTPAKLLHKKGWSCVGWSKCGGWGVQQIGARQKNDGQFMNGCICFEVWPKFGQKKCLNRNKWECWGRAVSHLMSLRFTCHTSLNRLRFCPCASHRVTCYWHGGCDNSSLTSASLFTSTCFIHKTKDLQLRWHDERLNPKYSKIFFETRMCWTDVS